MSNSWKIGEAKQQFSEVVRKSGEEPQLVFNRDDLAAAVVSAEDWRAFSEWVSRSEVRSLGEVFDEARAILEDERYTLRTPSRRDRKVGSFDGVE